ncbi:MAG: 23S rRNA (adenine(2503)-C(2))-methyltransferase RlmN [Anaerolineales bacterium]|nr:23S rRNA (adenine(2503)-C(2))-methyltransferase RlmN [Anaerolineales bacterium]
MDRLQLLYDLDLAGLTTLMQEWGEPAYRASQVWQGLYQHLWVIPEQFTSLPLPLRTKLAEAFLFSSLHPAQEFVSQNGETHKTLFRLHNGDAIETVLMRFRTRRTLCISTQSGCGMGCVFCATGQMGLQRSLSAGEIVEQVLYYARKLAVFNEKVTNVVVMGMGEPFHNYEATLAAIQRLNHPAGFNLGTRRFTISTVGLAPMIRRFTEEDHQINLAVSLHAANDELRSALIPINKKYPLEVLIAACREYVARTHRRITFEWALIRDLNDSRSHARQLADLVQGMTCHVNVIPLNPTQRYAGQATTMERAREFKLELESRGIPCTIRIRRGIDIAAGCGQLAIQA